MIRNKVRNLELNGRKRMKVERAQMKVFGKIFTKKEEKAPSENISSLKSDEEYYVDSSSESSSVISSQ